MANSYVTVTDQFCGAGGSSLGAHRAGAEIKMAINHWKLAVETHNSNFPDTDHDCTDISACDPRRYPKTDILITSPECTNHSLAKGKPRKHQGQLSMWGDNKPDPSEERSRATMWDVPRFAEYHDYRAIIVENVVDARMWKMWESWLHAMTVSLDYNYEIVYFNSMFAHPTPQSRDRMYVVFWKRGNRKPDLAFTPPAYCPACNRNVAAVQSWKNPAKKWGRYGKNRQYIYCCPDCGRSVEPYYYAAYNAIDWSLKMERIGDRKKPLKEKTIRRIEMGLEKYGRQPLLLGLGANEGQRRPFPTIDGAFPTQTGTSTFGFATPFIINTTQYNSDSGFARSLSEPGFTQTTAQSFALVVGLDHTHAENNRAYPMDGPLPTQTARQDKALVMPPAFIYEFKGAAHEVRSIESPLSTIHGMGPHHYLVQPFVTSYYGTDEGSPITDALGAITTKDRHAIVQPVPELREDCYFRMLQPSEIQAAMAFPSDYKVLGTSKDKVKQLGNAVTPPVMGQIIDRCIATLG